MRRQASQTFARNRDTAEDALEQIAVEYRPLPPIVDPEAAAWPDAPLLHPAVGSNVISERAFRYGDPETAFAEAEHRCFRPVIAARCRGGDAELAT
jgi:2-furoyl-CoA dehydrogenase large subunit